MRIELLDQQGQVVQLRGTLDPDEVVQALAQWCRAKHAIGRLTRWAFDPTTGAVIVEWSETWKADAPGRRIERPAEPEPEPVADKVAGYVREEWRSGI